MGPLRNGDVIMWSARAWATIAFVACTCLPATSLVANERNQKAKDLIFEATDEICGELLHSGSKQEIEIAGSAEAHLNTLLKMLAEIGIQGDARFNSKDYINVKRDELARELKSNRECRLEIWNDLKHLLYAEQPEQQLTRKRPQESVITNQTIQAGDRATIVTGVEGDVTINQNVDQ